MRLLDLFCGAGGAAMGYSRAGFDEIVGIDIVPQENYPFTFIQGDALKPPVRLEDFDLIHASPPCQAYSTLRTVTRRECPDLIAATRELIGGFPYVIENVRGAPLPSSVMLCGSSFGLAVGVREAAYWFQLRRHRLFETSFPSLGLPCHHDLPTLGVYGRLAKTMETRRPGKKGSKASRAQARALMGIYWMTDAELVEAIPPAYTEYLGRQFLDQLART